MITRTLALALVIGIALAGALLQMAELPPYRLLALAVAAFSISVISVVIAVAILAARIRELEKGRALTQAEPETNAQKAEEVTHG